MFLCVDVLETEVPALISYYFNQGEPSASNQTDSWGQFLAVGPGLEHIMLEAGLGRLHLPSLPQALLPDTGRGE